MVAVIEEVGVPNMVCYNYRRVPAVSFVKQLNQTARPNASWND
jgi:hypothetical protein